MKQTDLAIGPVLKWEEVGKRPFGSYICSISSEARLYWKYLRFIRFK